MHRAIILCCLCTLPGTASLLQAQPDRALLIRTWRLEDLYPGYDLAELSSSDRADALIMLEQMKQTAQFDFRADSTYHFVLDGEERGRWQYDAGHKQLLTYRMDASRPDTFRVERLTPDTLRMETYDWVRDASYRYTLVPMFSLPTGMARHIIGEWTIGRIEYDTRLVPDERQQAALRQQMDSLRTGSRWQFTAEGAFSIQMLGEETTGRYSVTNGNYLTTVEPNGARTSFIISAASPDAVLLVSNDTQRTPASVQLVLVPYRADAPIRTPAGDPQTGPWRKR
ncbi:MAG: hypothetical protein KF690_07335 [Bacteroidetes bacterium]|nr:hypothetical protein [Bacteroidota bacterium]